MKPAHQDIRSAVLVGFACSSLIAPFAYGQESAELVELEEILVTGSRLSRTGFETPSPVIVIGTEEIRSSTSVVLGDLLNELPQLRTTFGLSNSSRFIGTAGIGSLDLRGLGTQRTLVLVNGRRHVSSSEGEVTVDVNSIPTDMIERIEIITGANSAVYGADAVAGVVNFILKGSFEGTRLRTSLGEADDTGFGRASFAITTGHEFAEGRGSAIFSIGYEEQDLLTAGERGGNFARNLGLIANPADNDVIDANGIQVDDGIPDDITVPNQGFWALSNGGTSLDLLGSLNPDGSFSPIPLAAFEFIDGLTCGGSGCTALDLNSFQVLQTELKRSTLDANFNYDFSKNLRWYFESRLANVDSRQQGQPSFDFGAPIVVQRDNAFVSPSFAAAMDAAGATSADLLRFNVDLGLRQEQNNRKTVRVVTGFIGEFGDGFEFDVFANYGNTSIERVNLNNRIDERFAAATDAVVIDATGAADLVASGLFGGAAAGDIVCRSTLQEAQGETSGLPAFAFDGCIPLNILGEGRASPEAIDFVNSTALGLANIQQTQLQAIVSNPELFESWAGSFAGVFGLEYREERSFVRGDSLSALGNTFFNALADTRGNFDVSEVFVEGSLPLLREKPGARDLTFEAAARYSDYSTIGETFAWEARLNWQPVKDVRVRVNVGEALRAPTIGDLFAPAGENFNIVDDPCDMDNLDLGTNGRNTRIANCQALGIVDPTTFDSLDEQSIPLLQGGNPNLNEEEAETLTVGLVFSPRWVDGLQLSLDWYDITISQAIALTGSQAILDRCVDNTNGIDNLFCPLVSRDSGGNIVELRRFPLNLNEFQTNGFDIEIDYRHELGGFGTLSNRLVAANLSERIELLNSDDDVDIIEGELGDPEWQINYRGALLFQDWEVFVEGRWMDDQFIVEQELLFGSGTNKDPNPDVNDNTVADSIVYVDIGASYTFQNGLNLGITIDNVFDEDPPLGLFGNGGASGLYDNVGRFYLARASWSFGESR